MRDLNTYRKCIAKKSKKEEHLIELADLQIVALGVSYAAKRKSVELIFRDKALKDCLEAVFVGQSVIGVNVINSSILLEELLH